MITCQAVFRSQRQWACIFISLTTPMAMGTQLAFKRHRESHYSSQCSRKLRFRHLYVIIFTDRPLPRCKILKIAQETYL